VQLDPKAQRPADLRLLRERGPLPRDDQQAASAPGIGWLLAGGVVIVPSCARLTGAVGATHRRAPRSTPADPLPAAGLVDHVPAPCPHSDPTIGVADAGQAESDLAAP